jgi:hypothetical protein
MYRVRAPTEMGERFGSEMIAPRTCDGSGFDGDGLQSGEISTSIETGDVAADLDLSDSINFHIPQQPGKYPHQLLVARSNSLSFAVIGVARRSVPSEKLFERSGFNELGRRGADETRKITQAWGPTLSLVRQGEELERAVGLTRKYEARTRPLQFLLQPWDRSSHCCSISSTRRRD